LAGEAGDLKKKLLWDAKRWRWKRKKARNGRWWGWRSTGRSRGAIRQVEDGATGAQHASRAAVPVSRRAAVGKATSNDVVADAEEDDCAGLREPRAFSSRDDSQYGNDGGSRAANGFGKGGTPAVFQSAEKMAVPVI